MLSIPRSFIPITLLAAVGLFTAGCTGGSSTASNTDTPNKASADDIKIGLVASLTGDLLPWGVDAEKGAKLAVQEFNDAGGLNGKKVQLLVEDSASRPEQGKSAAEKLINDGAICLLGEVSSGITAQMAQPAKEKGIPVIAIGATRTDLTDGTNDVFRVCYTDKLQGPVMAKFAYDELHLRNVAIMTDKTQPYSKGLSDSFRAFYVKLGGTIADEQFYESKQSQFSAQLTQLKAKNPDGIFCSGYFTEVGPIVKQARESGIGKQVPFLGGDGWDSREISNSGGDAIVGSFFCNHYNNKEENPVVQEFLKKWIAANNGSLPATTMGALGYDAAKLALDALKRAKTPTSKDLREAIDNTVGLQCVSGTITLKGFHGNPPKRALVVQLTDDKENPQKFAKSYDYYDVFPEEKPKDAAAPTPPATGATSK